MNDQTNTSVAKREDNPLVALNKQLEARADQYKHALPSHIKPEDLQRTVVMAAQQNPKLLEADRRTLMLACMKAAQDGLLPDGREAALVPFTVRKKVNGNWQGVTEAQYMPMVYGLRKKILQSDEISTMNVGVVYHAEYESGRFLFELGLEPPIRHKPDLLLSDEDIADEKIVAAYSLVKFKDGSFSGEVMRRAEIDKIRELSQTGATKDYKGNPRQSKGPWADHFAEMAKKTVMRRHSKVLPMSGDIFRDVEGAEQDVAIRSAVQTLDAVDEAAPVSLPHHDEGTGEVLEHNDGTPGDEREAMDDALDGDSIPALDKNKEQEPARDPKTGMTEVTEEEARALDAGDQDDGDTEQEAEEVEDAAEDAKDTRTESEKRLDQLRTDLGKCKTEAQVSAVDAAWVKARAAYDDDLAEAFDKDIRARTAAVKKGGGK